MTSYHEIIQKASENSPNSKKERVSMKCIIVIEKAIKRSNIKDFPADIVTANPISGGASPTFGHANANFSVFINRIRSQFLMK